MFRFASFTPETKLYAASTLRRHRGRDVATPSAVSAERFEDKDSGSFALFDCVEHLAIEMF